MIKLDGVAPLITDPPPTRLTTLFNKKKGDVTHDMGHMTHDTCHVTFDM